MDQSSQIQISPERQQAFFEFVRSLPRTCSPSLFDDSQQRLAPPSLPSPTTTKSLPTPTQSSSLTSGSGDQFQWSIDEYALIYGQDFSNENELEDFQLLIHSSAISKELDSENERFFSQDRIIPSPNSNQQSSTQFSQELSHDTGCVSRSTGSFIRLLDQLPLQCHSTQYEGCFASQTSPQPESTAGDFSMISSENSARSALAMNSTNMTESSGSGIKISICDSEPMFRGFQTPVGQFMQSQQRFLDDISPIVSGVPATNAKASQSQMVFTPKTTDQQDRKRSNKENLGASPMSSPIYYGGTVKKRTVTFASASMVVRHDSPNFQTRPSHRIPLASNTVNHQQQQMEFKTPPQPAWRSSRTKILRAKLLFQEFTSTPNNQGSAGTTDNFLTSPQQVQS